MRKQQHESPIRNEKTRKILKGVHSLDLHLQYTLSRRGLCTNPRHFGSLTCTRQKESKDCEEQFTLPLVGLEDRSTVGN